MHARIRTTARTLAALAAVLGLAGCDAVLNDPYPAAERGGNILYSTFVTAPKTLDPARAYASDEWAIIEQVLEPPLQYHYLKRPYELIPQSAAAMPVVRLYDAAGRELAPDAPAAAVASSEYEIRIRPGIRYQPHPAFAIDAAGKPRYLALDEATVKRHYALGDFRETGTRELVADDFVYQIKRLAHPRLASPVFAHLADYIIGLKELGEVAQARYKALVAEHQARYGAADRGFPFLDLRELPLAGVTVVDPHTFRIRLKGRYPQFIYWLAMPFFAPVAPEVDRFHSQRGMNDGRNLTLDWYPVGTGPYMLAENNPNARMVLRRNPNFRGEAYPAEGEPDDRKEGLLDDAGKTVPFIDAVVLARERESIPLWNKFLQGYYDSAGIGADNFDQAVQVNFEGQATLTDAMTARGIRLESSVNPSTYYLAFNWADKTVGGATGERGRKLRQAISIALDWDEYITIFANGRGLPGMSPIPPGIWGRKEGEAGVNPVVYDWVDGRPVRKSIETARRLLAEAGFPDGRDARSGDPLVLYLDAVQRGPGDKAQLDWYRRQFAKLSIQLEIRPSDWNRFQEKIRTGNTQLFFMGWNADYPDPENFLFLLYGPQSAETAGGNNRSKYVNAEFDRLFDEMKNLENGPARQAIIDRMVRIVQDDAPWSFALHPTSFTLRHEWLKNSKPGTLARNGLKFQRIDVALRAARRAEWNRPLWWPIALGLLVIFLTALPAWRAYRRRERSAALT